MRRPPVWSLLVLLLACDAQISDGRPVDDAAVSDAVGDAVMVGPWSTPIKVRPAATAEIEDDVSLSSNALELIFAVEAGEGKDLYYTSRSSTDTAWALAQPLPFVGDATSEESPRFSADDRTLYFASDRAGNGNLDVYAVTRTGPGNTSWGLVQPLSGVNTTTLVEKWFAPCAGGRYVVVQNGRTGSDLLEGTLGGGAPMPITELNSAEVETAAFLTRDCLTIYFASGRTTPGLIFTSHRASVSSPWQPPVPVTDFATLGGNQEDPWLAPDGRTFAFVSDVEGDRDVYLSTR